MRLHPQFRLIAPVALGVLSAGLLPCAIDAQVVEITNDQGVVLTGIQTVNVGEHVRLTMRATPAGTPITGTVWVITGVHLRDWSVKDAEPVPMGVADYTGASTHLVWKDVTGPFAPNVVRATALVGGAPVWAELRFDVVRNAKPEKYYSDDLLMESHNNWHSVYMFRFASTRRGDLFLAWHRSQVDFFNQWRTYFGYPPLPYWNPTHAWSAAIMPPTLRAARAHPSSAPAPAKAFSKRHDLITLSLTAQGLATASEGEFDLVTEAQGRGRRPEFVAAGHILRTETVRQVGGFPSADPNFARSGIATTPTWWQPNTGQTATDPWFAAGCPAQATTTSPTLTSTCAAASKRSFSDYTLRELGESIESGWYASDFRSNYHALGHIAASEDMANPVTSMRDPIFWGWHSEIDSILTRWQRARGGEAPVPISIYGKPSFDAVWGVLTVAFSGSVVSDFVRPGHVRVNGSAATSVTEVTDMGSGPGYIFRFSGFAVPTSGPVEVVVRREINNTVRTATTQPRPAPTLIFGRFGNVLEPAVTRYSYVRP